MGEGRETQEGGYMCTKFSLIRVVVKQKPTPHCKTIFLQLKNKFKKDYTKIINYYLQE